MPISKKSKRLINMRSNNKHEVDSLLGGYKSHARIEGIPKLSHHESLLIDKHSEKLPLSQRNQGILFTTNNSLLRDQ